MPSSVSARPARHLVRHQHQRHEGEQRRGQHAGGDRRENAEDRLAGLVAGDEAADRAHDHHALDAEVEDAGALGHQFAERGEEQRRRRDDDGDDDGFGHAHSAALAAWTCGVRTKRTR